MVEIEWVDRIHRRVPYGRVNDSLQIQLETLITDTNHEFYWNSLAEVAGYRVRPEEIGRLRVELFQEGRRNHVLRVKTVSVTEHQAFIFGIIAAKTPEQNTKTEEDFTYTNELRDKFPDFSHYLQEPILSYPGGEKDHSMFSVRWHDDYYEIAVVRSDRDISGDLIINDYRAMSDGTCIYDRDIASSDGRLSDAMTKSVIRAVSKILTIFYDEEAQRGINPKSVELKSGDVIHRSDFSPGNIKLTTIRNLTDLSVEDFLNEMYGYTIPLGGNMMWNLLLVQEYLKARAFGIVDGLMEKYGSQEGRRTLERWLSIGSKFGEASLLQFPEDDYIWQPVRPAPVGQI